MKKPKKNQDQNNQNKEKNSEDQSDKQPHPYGEEVIDLSSTNLDNLPPNADAAIPPGYEVESFLYAHYGPLPPPAELAAYEKVLPGLAHRIVAMTETVVEAGTSNEKYVLKAEYALQWGGLIAFYMFAFSCLGSGIYLALQGKDGYAIGLILAGIASIILAIRGRNSELLNKILGKIDSPKDKEE